MPNLSAMGTIRSGRLQLFVDEWETFYNLDDVSWKNSNKLSIERGRYLSSLVVV